MIRSRGDWGCEQAIGHGALSVFVRVCVFVLCCTDTRLVRACLCCEHDLRSHAGGHMRDFAMSNGVLLYVESEIGFATVLMH